MSPDDSTPESPPEVTSLLRTVAAYGTLLPSMMGGVAMGVLNRDRQTIVGYGVPTFVERFFTITGVKLDVQGEENLWSHRPAVFVYNHRNNFDPYVAIKLVHRDWGSVAKKEIAGPLAPVMQWLMPNVAFIDRSSSEKAVEGLAPVTELLRGGVSVLVAPEGTRSRTGELGPFKKGPFRMAMEANAPIVPIVIRNADQVANRAGAITHSGTVDVAVLEPVSVAGWTATDLTSRIDGVRQRFVDKLADW
jgi:putative phosphoserine phosphatase / 1-acylglycerol-3-phosphate O-acyltransferase